MNRERKLQIRDLNQAYKGIVGFVIVDKSPIGCKVAYPNTESWAYYVERKRGYPQAIVHDKSFAEQLEAICKERKRLQLKEQRLMDKYFNLYNEEELR